MSKKIKWLIIFLIIIILVFLGVIIWKFYFSNPQITQKPSPPVSSPSLSSPSPAKTSTTAPSQASDDWLTYTNKTFNYSFKYPSDCKINETSFISVNGPKTANDWPHFEIYHFDSEFYHPPAGTDVYEWITQKSKVTYDETDPSKDIKIAGLPAIHLKNHKSLQAEASDYYFFIKGEQLFGIQIIQVSDKEDWDLYNKFLASFTFNN